MKKVSPVIFTALGLVVLGVFFFTFRIIDQATAFTGPPANPYSLYGFIKTNTYDTAIGVENPRATTTLLITGSDSTSNNFSLKVDNLNLDQIFKIRNNQVVTVGKNIIPSDPGAASMTQGFANPYYLLQTETIYSPNAKVDKLGFGFSQTQNSLFVDNWNVKTTLQGLPGGASAIKNFNSIQANQIFPDLTPASNVVGYSGSVPSSPGIFGAQTGAPIYAFPAKLGVGTTTVLSSGLPEALTVQGGAYLTGNVGIGKTPAAKLDVLGTVKSTGLDTNGLTKTVTFQLTTLPSNGYVLTSDASGNGTWKQFNPGLPAGSSNQTLRHNGASWVVSSFLINTDTGVGIGKTPTSELDVAGTIKSTGLDTNGLTKTVTFQLTPTGWSLDYILKSDANGYGTWQVPSGLPGGSTNRTLRHDGFGWTGSSFLTNTNTGVGVGVGVTPITGGTYLEVGSGGYLQFGKVSDGDPNTLIPTDCNTSAERGRLVLNTGEKGRLYICGCNLASCLPSRWQTASYWYTDSFNPTWSWSYRKRITIISSAIGSDPPSGALDTKSAPFMKLMKIAGLSPVKTAQAAFAGNLANFPIVYRSSGTDLTKALPSGNDILFTKADGITKIDHEIESFDGTNLVAWVEVPVLSGTADTIIYMYYGNGAATNQQNIAGTWDSFSKGVWHLEESVTDESTAGLHSDSTSNGRTGTQFYNSSLVGSIIYNGQYFDAKTGNSTVDYINVTNNSSYGFDDDTITYSAWVKFADLGGTGFKGIIAHNNSGESYNILFDAGISTSATDNRIGFYVKKTNGWSSVSSPAGSINDTTKWYYLTLTHSGGVLTGYVDGVSIGTITNANSIVKSSFSAIQFGLYGTSAGSEYLNGYIDEVKISNTARPLTWIKTEYNNQAKPSSFLYTSLENEY